MDKEQRIKKLYCKWCPQEDICKEDLTEEEMMGCLACGGFAEEINALFPQGDDEGLVDINAILEELSKEDKPRTIMMDFEEIRKRQHDLTRQDAKAASRILEKIRSWFVTTIEPDGTKMHHIDEAEWQALESRILGDK